MHELAAAVVLLAALLTQAAPPKATVLFGAAANKEWDPQQKQMIEYPQKGSAVVELHKSHYLQFRVTLEDEFADPQQLFLLFRHKDKDFESFLTPSNKRNGHYQLITRVRSQAFSSYITEPGLYDVDLLIAGDNVPATQWTIGQVNLKTTESTATKYKYQDCCKSRPLISITPPSTPNRPSQVISLAFTGLTLAPFGALFLLWNKISLRRRVIGSTTTLWILVFQGSILAFLCVLTVYWLQWNIFEAMKAMLVVSCVAVPTGRAALSGLMKKKKD